MSCMWVVHSGQFGDVCVWGSIVCRYDWRRGDLFVRSCANLLLVGRGSDVSDVCIFGAMCCMILLL